MQLKINIHKFSISGLSLTAFGKSSNLVQIAHNETVMDGNQRGFSPLGGPYEIKSKMTDSFD